MAFKGAFETHITVEFHQIDRLQQWCAARELQLLHILLDRGATRSQPMLTRRGYGDLDGELKIANELAQALTNAGFGVVRIKLEAAPENQDIPQSDSEARCHSPERYFEHHLKLRLSPTQDLRELAELASQHAAHLSRNALQRHDLFQERFVTQRCGGVGQSEANHRLNSLVKAIASAGDRPIDIRTEFVVYDSNLALDRGWIRMPLPRR